MAHTSHDEGLGVFELLSELCTNTAAKYCANNRLSQKRLSNKMRSFSYEIILRKSQKDVPVRSCEPISDLLSYYFVAQQTAKNAAEFKKALELKEVISVIRQKDFGDDKENVYNIIKCLVSLQNSVEDDLSSRMFQKPFSFGIQHEMLPKPPIESFGSPQPYPYYPSHVFELPFSIKRQGNQDDTSKYSEYAVECFDSRSFLPESSKSQAPGQMELKTFLSPMSLASMTSTHMSPYSESGMFNWSPLTAPRDLLIPGSHTNVKVSYPSTEIKSEDVQEVFRAEETADIWELATQVDKDIPDDLWEIVCKMPPITERQLIATSPREMSLWRRIHEDIISDLNIISERQFIRHIMYLCIGVETNTFPYNEESNQFYMKNNIVLEGISKEHINGYISELLVVGTYYRRLFKFAFNQSLDDQFYSNGLVYEAAREVIRRYLLDFRLKSTSIFEECCKNAADDTNCLPTLLQILFHMEPLKYDIETVASIYKMIDIDTKSTLPLGAELMSYLFNEISLVTQPRTAHTMFNSLFSVCKVYFQFIERFIFEGELDDRYNEFFIRKDLQYVNCRSKRYWDKGFHITQSMAVPDFLRPLAKFILLCGKSLRLLKLCNPSYVNCKSKRYWDKGFHITQSMAVPDFLRPLAKFILLCGKSLRLLKLCNPSDPLILLISSDHPTVKCCASFTELEHQQQLLDVYRTRCLFVTGELVTFDSMLLKREAERKAFAEMATLKQADTLEKIVAERKRLAQLIIAEKQHSLKVLEAAMAEAKAAKLKAKRRDRVRLELEAAGDKAVEEVDSMLKDDERNKIMEYYSKLNMEVEKKQIHTEWKIKRLQLDQSRMQLLSTEERNLKREKLELEHQKSEEMANLRIIENDETDNNDKEQKSDSNEVTEDKMTESTNSVVMLDVEVKEEEKKTQSDVFSALCSAAKNFFTGSKNDDKNCDNKKRLDSQGNIVNEENCNTEHTTSSGVIGANIDEFVDNEQFLKARNEARVNKQKVMAHEFGHIDRDNMKTVDIENNLKEEWSPYEEARRNKKKVLGDEFNLPPRIISAIEPVTDAQKEALVNKQKVLGDLFNVPTRVISSIEPITDAQKEALVNKQKVLGDDFNLPPRVISSIEPITDAQKEALVNKQKVLGVEYNLPADPVIRRDPANVAQEEAIRNRNKVLTSEYETRERNPKGAKRSGLTLNLKPYGESPLNVASTPNAPVTPGEMFPRLDLETPTTADVPLEGAMTSDIFTPRSECGKEIGSEKSKQENEYLSTDGFNFPMLDDVTENENTSDVQSPENSPSKIESQTKTLRNKYSFFNILDGSYNLDDFDPFGVKDLKKYSNEHFNSKMDLEMSNSCYTHPALIMEEVKKRPYANIFASHFGLEEEKDERISSDNIATLTACLQRSVMLPLTYQLEVVNNGILTYFLVNLDMYEHLRSLKDYFFLMDGEFSRSICHNLFAKLTKTLNPQELLNFGTLHNILDKALGSSISHVHKFSENLSFTISDIPLSFQHSSPDVLQCLSLTYSVSWPLNIIMSQEALLRYAKVFQFLIKMRRIFWVLGEDFENLKLTAKLSRQNSKLLRAPQYTSIQIYRHTMASMIRALDNYIVTTCILTSWTEFEKDLKKARTLDDLYECHVVYIKKVLFRCLLNNRSTPVMKLLNDMFTVILKFSRVLKAGEWQQKEPEGYFTHTSFQQLEELFHLFEKLAKYLHKVVTKLMECGYQRHLVELLTMINLNGYYDPERSNHEANLSTQ